MSDEMYDEIDEVRYTTHPKAVAGIVVMASLMLFSTVFTVTILIAALVSPLDARATLDGYLAVDRAIMAAIAGVIVTALFWTFVD